MEQEYYIGLDIGTSSVGWAVTDMNYQIIKRHGKALWGSRLFASANTAEERRGFRTARRRLDRRNWRINILQELFAEEISKVDSGFYLRMKESKYYPEDKKDSSGKCPELPYALFVDKDYTDKDYHKEYPTIYHLRKMLMETEKVPDIRLVYLAIHHMMKHRGHFLLSGDINQVTEFENTFLQFAENLKNEELDFQVEMSEERIKEVEIVLKDKNLTKSAKKNRLIKYFGAKSACEKAVFTLITGGTVKLSDVLGNEELNNCEKDKISFSDNNYDEYVGTVEEDLGEQFYIIESAKAVYDWSILADILGDSASISEAKVKSYEKHKEDLAYLKKVVKQYLPKEIYKKVFVITEDKLCNYPAYIGMTKINGKKVDLQGKQCSREDFLSFLKKEVVKKIEDESVKNYLSEEIEKDTFLPRQVNKDNGVIPYQIHKFELKKIIDNLSDKMPFIKENGEKIMQLFEFRIPYYVGPLGKKSEKFAWAVRKNDDKIYPWNFEQVIDVEESAEKFIRRMTNKCTYLIGEDVLPKDSLLYSKYMAGTAKTFYSLAVGLEKILNNPTGEYRRILICRPNAQFDSDIGFLPGDEQEKISPLMRPIMDNLEQLIDSDEEARYQDEQELQGKIEEIFARGIIQAEAMNFIRGRSFVNTYLIIDEAQNMTPNQVKGIITRAGKGTKIVLLGDPNQIDRPFLDERTNGLSYASEYMKGSPLCYQITMSAEECERSELAMDAIRRL